MTTNYTPNFGLALPDFRMAPWHDLVNGNSSTIDSLLYSALSGADVVAWTNSTHYAAGVTAIDQVDGTTWVCVTANTSSAAPTTFAQDRVANPSWWTTIIAGFAPRGEWAHNTNYFPYDLAYQTNLGIFALCKTKHISNAAGTIKDDSIYWSFLCDMSGANLSTAKAVTYDSSVSGIGKPNVQEAIDYIQTEVVSLNNVNITQGTNITNLQASDGAQNTRLANIESLNSTQDTRLTNVESVNATQTAADTSLQNQINALPPPPNMANYVVRAGDTMTGLLTTAAAVQAIGGPGGMGTIMVMGGQPGVTFHSPGAFACNFGMDTGGEFYYGGWSYGNVAYKLWSTKHFTSLPVIGQRLVFAGDQTTVGGVGGPMPEPYAGAVITGVQLISIDVLQIQARFRYLQYQLGNGAWYTAGYA